MSLKMLSIAVGYRNNPTVDRAERLLAALQSSYPGSCQGNGVDTANAQYFSEVTSRNQAISVIIRDRTLR